MVEVIGDKASAIITAIVKTTLGPKHCANKNEHINCGLDRPAYKSTCEQI